MKNWLLKDVVSIIILIRAYLNSLLKPYSPLIAIERSKTAEIHCIGYLFQRFYDGIAKAPENLRHTLNRLCLLYGLKSIQQHAASFLQYGYFEPSHMDIIQNQVNLKILIEIDKFHLNLFSYRYINYMKR